MVYGKFTKGSQKAQERFIEGFTEGFRRVGAMDLVADAVHPSSGAVHVSSWGCPFTSETHVPLGLGREFTSRNP
eukprot:352845-Chlamydomonas_euryale.AAC.3